ncbi:unnamed protein product [Ectocarpus sp. 12 AP-2014]
MCSYGNNKNVKLMSYGYTPQQPQMPQMPQQQQYNPNQFMPGVQSTGYAATPATTAVGQSPMGVLATMAMSKQLGGIFGSSSSSSYSSSSSKVSIVKYDDHFKKLQKDWCLNNLKDLDGNPSMTADEIKANPPLGLYFKDCDLIIPIPNPQAMCATTQHLLALLVPNHASVDDATLKRTKENLSRALLQQYVEDCGYGTARLTREDCAKPRMVVDIPAQTLAAAAAAQATRDAARAAVLAGGASAQQQRDADVPKSLRAFMGIH